MGEGRLARERERRVSGCSLRPLKMSWKSLNQSDSETPLANHETKSSELKWIGSALKALEDWRDQSRALIFYEFFTNFFVNFFRLLALSRLDEIEQVRLRLKGG